MNEHAIQKAIVRYLDTVLPPYMRVIAVPNGGQRHVAVAAKLKAEGVKSGVPDLLLFRPGGNVACIEVKKEGGYLSKTQKEWRDWFAANGFEYAVVRSIDDVRETLQAWNVPTKETQSGLCK